MNLIIGKFIKRYKRFFVDVELDSGEIVTAHCANTGTMKTCLAIGAPIALSVHDDPKRKLKYSVEMTYIHSTWIGINTSKANQLIHQAILDGHFPTLGGYQTIKPEQQYADHHRIDLLLSAPDRPDCFVEVKNTTYLVSDGWVAFPDAVTERGTKHLHALAKMVKEGKRAVLIFCVTRMDADRFRPAIEVDRIYTDACYMAKQQGVEFIAARFHFTPEQIVFDQLLEVELP